MKTTTTRALVAVIAAGSMLAAPAVTASPAHAAPAAAIVAKPGSTGATVKIIQNDLHLLGYFRTTVNGYYGPVTTAAVKKFQAAYRLKATGTTDQTTYRKLRTVTDARRKAAAAARAKQAAAQKAHNAAVVARPGDRNNTVKQIQGRLAGLGYLPASSIIGIYGPQTTAAVKRFQAANRLPATGVVNGLTNDRLIARYLARPKTAAVRLDSRCYTGRTVCVDKSAHKMYWVVNGSIKATYTVRVGRPSLPTREGTFKIYMKNTNWFSTLYHVNMPYSQFFSGGEAIHFSRDFQLNGYSGGGSHGCVNMNSMSDARWLYNQTRVGDRVVVYA